MIPDVADVGGHVVHHLDLEGEAAHSYLAPYEALFPEQHGRLRSGVLAEGLDHPLGRELG